MSDLEPNEKVIDSTFVTVMNYNSNNNSTAVLSGSSLSDITQILDYTPPESDHKKSAEEFAARYVSLDALTASEDGSDIAYLRVLQYNNGKFGKQVFPNTDGIYKEFIVTAIDNGYAEKVQLLKTNNTLQIYSFGSQIEILTISGVLKSTMSDKWDTAMILLWDDLIRAQKLIQRNLIVEMGYESNIYWGMPINFRFQKSSNTMYLASYNMQFVVVKRSISSRNILGNPLLDSVIMQLDSIDKNNTVNSEE